MCVLMSSLSEVSGGRIGRSARQIARITAPLRFAQQPSWPTQARRAPSDGAGCCRFGVSLRAIERAVAHLRRAVRGQTEATGRVETPPDQRMQIDFGTVRLSVGGEQVNFRLFVAKLGHSGPRGCVQRAPPHLQPQLGTEAAGVCPVSCRDQAQGRARRGWRQAQRQRRSPLRSPGETPGAPRPLARRGGRCAGARRYRRIAHSTPRAPMEPRMRRVSRPRETAVTAVNCEGDFISQRPTWEPLSTAAPPTGCTPAVHTTARGQ